MPDEVIQPVDPENLPDGQEKVALQGILAGHYVVINTEAMTRKWVKGLTADDDSVYHSLAAILISTDLPYKLDYEALDTGWPIKKLNQLSGDVLEFIRGPKAPTS